jgi:hypothetical protein
MPKYIHFITFKGTFEVLFHSIFLKNDFFYNLNEVAEKVKNDA